MAPRLLLSAFFYAIFVVGDPEKVTIWSDESVDLLECVASECETELKTCYEDEDHCNELISCSKECPVSDSRCVLKKCGKIAVVSLTDRAALKKFYNLTSCVIKKCPKQQSNDEKDAEEEEAEDAECVEAVSPIDRMMNTTKVDATNCIAKLSIVNDQVGNARQACKEELDVTWMAVRNYVLHHGDNNDFVRCKRIYDSVHRKVEQVIAARLADEDEAQDAIHEDQGEFDNCENMEFEDGEPWMDSDGDTCAVYTRFVCNNGQFDRHNVETGCESGDCRGSGSKYAYDACCSCGGGVKGGASGEIIKPGRGRAKAVLA